MFYSVKRICLTYSIPKAKQCSVVKLRLFSRKYCNIVVSYAVVYVYL